VIIFVALYSGSDLQNSTNRITIPGSGSGAELPADVAAQYEKDASKFETVRLNPNPLLNGVSISAYSTKLSPKRRESCESDD
jgi:hypothetical protein